jgi:hypothetical protein
MGRDHHRAVNRSKDYPVELISAGWVAFVGRAKVQEQERSLARGIKVRGGEALGAAISGLVHKPARTRFDSDGQERVWLGLTVTFEVTDLPNLRIYRYIVSQRDDWVLVHEDLRICADMQVAMNPSPNDLTRRHFPISA